MRRLQLLSFMMVTGCATMRTPTTSCFTYLHGECRVCDTRIVDGQPVEHCESARAGAPDAGWSQIVAGVVTSFITAAGAAYALH